MKRRPGIEWVVCGTSLAIVAALWSAPRVAAGQDADQPAKPSDRTGSAAKPYENLDGQLEALTELRQTLLTGLKLSDEQAARVNELFDEHSEKIATIVRDLQERRRKNARRADELADETEKAKQERDMPQMRELLKERNELMGDSHELQKAKLALTADIREVLNEDQQTAYREIITRWSRKHSPQGAPHSFARVLRTLRHVDRTDEQKNQIRDILRELSPKLSEANKGGDTEAMRKVSDEFRRRALDTLNEEQRAKFLEIEAKGDSGDDDTLRRPSRDDRRKPSEDKE